MNRRQWVVDVILVQTPSRSQPVVSCQSPVVSLATDNCQLAT
jgi:hypothetical protein